MARITAIETHYRDCLFRSRQEARWAVLFDVLGIPWRYEYEGFTLNDHNYLPDFLLPDMRTWVEVKMLQPTYQEFLDATIVALANPEFRMVLTWENFEEATLENNMLFWHDENGVFHSDMGCDWCPRQADGWAAARLARFDHHGVWPNLDMLREQFGELPY